MLTSLEGNIPIHSWLACLSGFLGWVYFACWSVSFYPQIISNYNRQSVTGLSADYIFANLFGFLCYAIFNASMYWSDSARQEYRLRHAGSDNLVAFNDVIFAWHAAAMALILALQVVVYRKPHEGTSCLGVFLAITLSIFIIGGFMVVGAGLVNFLDYLYALSYVKLLLTIVKCVPQAWMNWIRRSTRGFSIANVLLDFSGGILSISQLFLDAYISGHLAGIMGVLPKLVLGIISILFDTIFILQHYTWFPHHPGDGCPPRLLVISEEASFESEEVAANIIDGEDESICFKFKTCNGN